MPLPPLPDVVSKNRTPVDISPVIGSPYQLSVTGTSASQALTTGIGRISILARDCDMRYALGTGAVTASASTSHFIQRGERLDFALDRTAQTYIAAIAANSTGNASAGTLEITELG